MKNSKLLGWLLLVPGILLLLATAALILHNAGEDRTARESAQQVMSVLETTPVSQPQETAAATAPTEATDPTDPPTLSSKILEGHEYVGYLSFPSLDRELPVMKIRYLEDLQIAPCLENGSPLTDDAVISAHNYPSHFGPIRDWTGGEEVLFTTLDGQQIRYTVTLVETIEAMDVAAVMESSHDLVLYTCTTGGQKRVMIACDRV